MFWQSNFHSLLIAAFSKCKLYSGIFKQNSLESCVNEKRPNLYAVYFLIIKFATCTSIFLGIVPKLLTIILKCFCLIKFKEFWWLIATEGQSSWFKLSFLRILQNIVNKCSFYMWQVWVLLMLKMFENNVITSIIIRFSKFQMNYLRIE